ncbi:MAG: sigma-54-dependent Fis family transcriptional regulator [Planctomycetes bacterium]|nr:sigma-54-dependent Fis family transcriptional regulator [Planctomycetota bacterium]
MNQDGFHILIVDDEPNIRSGLAKGLSNEAGSVDTAKDGDEALALFDRTGHQLVIADLKLPGTIDGLELLKQIKHKRPETVVVVITAHSTVENAVEAMRRGAYDFITKPVDLNLIRHQVRKALEHHRLVSENRRLRERLAGEGEISDIVGNCAAMQEVFRQVRQVADTDATVLVQGESGTGKELVAQAIHNLSPRREGPFVAVNVGALPETLLESELFGYEKGAFSGATRRKLGRFELAEGGTLILDEITEMSPKTQVDLLRVLEQREFRRVGGEDLIASDVRVIAASNKDIHQLVGDSRFREDLYYRLNVIPIIVPPLRDRREDIPLLVEHFLQQFCERHRRESKRVAGEALGVLAGHSWPGNVRQLRNLIERLVVTVEGPVIHAADLPEEMRTPPDSTAADLTLAATVERAEKQAILQALAACNHHRERTAKLLRISVRNLHYRMNRYGLQ